jgi:hypothetical protein
MTLTEPVGSIDDHHLRQTAGVARQASWVAMGLLAGRPALP